MRCACVFLYNNGFRTHVLPKLCASVHLLSVHTCIVTNTNLLSLISALEGFLCWLWGSLFFSEGGRTSLVPVSGTVNTQTKIWFFYAAMWGVLEGREVTVFWHSSIADTVMQFTHHCYRMFLLTAQHRAVYYFTEESIPWLVSIRAHNKSHVPLLLTAGVLRSIGPLGWQGITTEVRRECMCAAPPKHKTPTHHLPHLLCINNTLFPVGKAAVRRHYSRLVKVRVWMSVRV